MRIKLLLLDFDGTLASTERANTEAYIEALAEQGIELSEEEYRAKYFGMRCPEFMTAIGITDPTLAEHVRRRKIEIYPSHFDSVHLNRPLWDFALDFRKQGGKVWVVSTGHPDNLLNAMNYLGITGDVDGILSSEDIEHPKPAPDAFIKAMLTEGVTPAETLIFEDSEVGLQAAEASGAAYFKVSLPY